MQNNEQLQASGSTEDAKRLRRWLKAALGLKNGLQQHLPVGSAHVPDQGGLLGEFLVAVAAHERLHLQVNGAQVPVEVPSLGEALGAVRAAEGLLLVVEALVGDQVTVSDVALAAERAPVRFRARVHVQVTRQVAALDEALSALLAVEALILLRRLLQ